MTKSAVQGSAREQSLFGLASTQLKIGWLVGNWCSDQGRPCIITKSALCMLHDGKSLTKLFRDRRLQEA
eukprot:339786-Pelagomonas_calceolata.AAC.3